MKVRRGVLDSIAEHARQSGRRECCGILLAETSAPTVVTGALRATNAAKDPEARYALGPEAHIQAVRMENADAARIVGYYHSHPQGAPRPSRMDTDSAVPGVSYLIVGLKDGSARYAAWRAEGNRLVADALEVSE